MTGLKRYYKKFCNHNDHYYDDTNDTNDRDDTDDTNDRDDTDDTDDLGMVTKWIDLIDYQSTSMDILEGIQSKVHVDESIIVTPLFLTQDLTHSQYNAVISDSTETTTGCTPCSDILEVITETNEFAVTGAGMDTDSPDVVCTTSLEIQSDNSIPDSVPHHNDNTGNIICSDNSNSSSNTTMPLMNSAATIEQLRSDYQNNSGSMTATQKVFSQYMKPTSSVDGHKSPKTEKKSKKHKKTSNKDIYAGIQMATTVPVSIPYHTPQVQTVPKTVPPQPTYSSTSSGDSNPTDDVPVKSKTKKQKSKKQKKKSKSGFSTHLGDMMGRVGVIPDVSHMVNSGVTLQPIYQIPTHVPIAVTPEGEPTYGVYGYITHPYNVPQYLPQRSVSVASNGSIESSMHSRPGTRNSASSEFMTSCTTSKHHGGKGKIPKSSSASSFISIAPKSSSLRKSAEPIYGELRKLSVGTNSPHSQRSSRTNKSITGDVTSSNCCVGGLEIYLNNTSLSQRVLQDMEIENGPLVKLLLSTFDEVVTLKQLIVAFSSKTTNSVLFDLLCPIKEITREVRGDLRPYVIDCIRRRNDKILDQTYKVVKIGNRPIVKTIFSKLIFKLETECIDPRIYFEDITGITTNEIGMLTSVTNYLFACIKTNIRNELQTIYYSEFKK